MPTLYTATTTLNVRSETIDRVAVISFNEMGKLLEPIASCEDVTTIVIKYDAAQTYNAHHTIVPSVNPESQKWLDASPDFYLISNPKYATSEIEQLKNALMGIDLVIILVELEEYNKFSATFTLPVFIKHIQMRCSKIVCVAKEPFHFAGVRRLNISEQCLAKLLEENIPVVTLDVNKFLVAIPNSIGLRDANIVIDSIVSSITCDLIKRLHQTEGWEALSQIVQKSSNSQIYFDMTKKAMKPQAQFIYTLFGRCNAPVLIESMPIMIDIPTIKDHKTDLNTTTLSSWIVSLLKGYKSKK